VGQVMGIGKSLARMGQPGEGVGIPKFLPKMMVETVVEDGMLEKVLRVLRDVCNTNTPGDGKAFVIHVEDALRIRTDERGENAIL
jgi:nitrogen regulatory protein P-II 1